MSDLDRTVARMLDDPAVEWWRYVGCAVCNSHRGEPCRKGGASWPDPAHQPHVGRYRLGLAVHGVFWLLVNFPGDLFGSDAADVCADCGRSREPDPGEEWYPTVTRCDQCADLRGGGR